jgi:hypothetical protein
LEWLENDGMGVCGYTHKQVSKMPIDALARAISSRIKFENGLTRARYGSGEDSPSAVVAPVQNITPALFDVLFP